MVEVISPSTRRIDRIEKFVEYAKAGVNEYWIVEPQEKTIEVYVLIEGAYTLFGKYGFGQSVRSKSLLNLEVLVDEVFLSELGGVTH